MIAPIDPRWTRNMHAISLALKWRLAYQYTERYAFAGDSWRERDVLVACGSGGTPDVVVARGFDFSPHADRVLREWSDLHRAVCDASWGAS